MRDDGYCSGLPGSIGTPRSVVTSSKDNRLFSNSCRGCDGWRLNRGRDALFAACSSRSYFTPRSRLRATQTLSLIRKRQALLVALSLESGVTATTVTHTPSLKNEDLFQSEGEC